MSDTPTLSALQALIAQWRTYADELKTAPDGGFLAGRHVAALNLCANELEALLSLPQQTETEHEHHYTRWWFTPACACGALQPIARER